MHNQGLHVDHPAEGKGCWDFVQEQICTFKISSRLIVYAIYIARNQKELEQELAKATAVGAWPRGLIDIDVFESENAYMKYLVKNIVFYLSYLMIDTLARGTKFNPLAHPKPPPPTHSPTPQAAPLHAPYDSNDAHKSPQD